MESALRRVGLARALATLGIGCNQPQQGEVPSGATGTSELQPVVTEHRFQPPLTAGDTGKPIGSDCSEHGADACASRLCNHTTASRSAGYVCSTRCLGHENCPASCRRSSNINTNVISDEGWTCLPISVRGKT